MMVGLIILDKILDCIILLFINFQLYIKVMGWLATLHSLFFVFLYISLPIMYIYILFIYLFIYKSVESVGYEGYL
jgi:hypothetical protein